MTLAVPSWLFPGTWLENLERMAPEPWIQGVELLFFLYDADSRETLRRELAGIAGMAGRFSFSVHLPDPLGPADEELVELTRPFADAYVIHAPGQAGGASWAGLVGSWRTRFGDVFHLEYTGRDAFHRGERALPGLPLCADTGRLLLDGIDPAAWSRERSTRVGAIHLHGVAGGKDHAPLAGGEPWLHGLVPFLAGFAGRVELEVFSFDGAGSSARALAALVAGKEAQP